MKNLVLLFMLLPCVAIAQQDIAPVVNHQSVCVKDLAASTRFYAEAMLLPKKQDPFKNGNFQWFVTGPGTELHLIKGDCDAQRFSNNHMAFSVKNLEGFMAHLDKLHVAYGSGAGAGKMQTRPDGVHQIYLTDPDGNTIEVNNAM